VWRARTPLSIQSYPFNLNACGAAVNSVNSDNILANACGRAAVRRVKNGPQSGLHPSIISTGSVSLVCLLEQTQKTENPNRSAIFRCLAVSRKKARGRTPPNKLANLQIILSTRCAVVEVDVDRRHTGRSQHWE
jgi:hypothetical protein